MSRSDRLTKLQSGIRIALASVTALLVGCVASSDPRIQTGPDAVVTPDGLHRVDNVPAGTLFIKPGYAYGSYGEFAMGDTVLTIHPDSRRLDEGEIAGLKQRFSEAARRILAESGPGEVQQRGPCVAWIHLALLNLELFDTTAGDVGGDVVGRRRFDSIGAVTLVMEIRDGHTGEALLRYGRRQRLIGDRGTGSDLARPPILNLAFHNFVVDFHRAFSESLPRLSPIARPLTCTQRAGIDAFSPEMDAIQEIEAALVLRPDLANGERIYETCARCHQADGSGLRDGSVPQLAGQHRSVVIKQLADIRAGNRDNPMMFPFAYSARIGGPQAIADVSGYIETLEMSGFTGKGSGDDLALGEQVFVRECAQCHGPRGEGEGGRYIPRIQAQHYAYLERHFESIRDGRRRNADATMAAQIRTLSDAETSAVLDYVSRLEPSSRN
jgi:cytochrome c553